MYNFIQTEWRTIKEFPEYEMNYLGIVRKRRSKVLHSVQVGNYETVMLTRDGKRFHRSIRSLLKVTFPENRLS